MARTHCWGFEINEGTLAKFEQATGTGTTFDTAIVRSGTYSGKVALTSGVAGSFIEATGVAFLGYVRFYIRVTARPATTARIIFGATGAGLINLRLNANGTVAHFVNTTLTGTSTTALTDTTRWYRIEFRIADGTTVPILLIDGVSEVTGSPATWTTTNRIGCTDTVADTYTAYFDDVAVDNAAFPGEGRVALLVPISDNARGANWTGGVGGTSNLFDAVNNRPPIGTATETNLTQIEHSGGANNSYDANMTSYATAGIGPSDTVNFVAIMAVDGEDVSAGSKLLAYSVVSNPAIASSGNVTAGDDGGALGTYPTTWAGRIFLASATSPSVTVATSPVMRVNRPETASRVASVCFMALYVEYTEHRSPPFSRRHRNMIIR